MIDLKEILENGCTISSAELQARQRKFLEHLAT